MLTVTFKEKEKVKPDVLKSMKKLRGSGNGRLSKRLLKERKSERSNG